MRKIAAAEHAELFKMDTEDYDSFSPNYLVETPTSRYPLFPISL